MPSQVILFLESSINILKPLATLGNSHRISNTSLSEYADIKHIRKTYSWEKPMHLAGIKLTSCEAAMRTTNPTPRYGLDN